MMSPSLSGSGRVWHLLMAATSVWRMVLWMIKKRSRTLRGSMADCSDTSRYATVFRVFIAQRRHAKNGILVTNTVVMVTTLIVRTDLATLWSLSISITQFFIFRCNMYDIIIVAVNGMAYLNTNAGIARVEIVLFGTAQSDPRILV